MHDHSKTPANTSAALRSFQNADASAVARLVTDSVRGHWVYPPERFRESTDPQRRRLVAEVNGEVVATAHLSPFGHAAPDALRLDLAGDGTLFTPLFLALIVIVFLSNYLLTRLERMAIRWRHVEGAAVQL